jgi:hypothetical protein
MNFAAFQFPGLWSDEMSSNQISNWNQNLQKKRNAATLHTSTPSAISKSSSRVWSPSKSGPTYQRNRSNWGQVTFARTRPRKFQTSVANSSIPPAQPPIHWRCGPTCLRIRIPGRVIFPAVCPVYFLSSISVSLSLSLLPLPPNLRGELELPNPRPHWGVTSATPAMSLAAAAWRCLPPNLPLR